MELNNRKVIVLSVGGVDSKDYPDFCDAYFEEAEYADTGELLTMFELEDLGELYPDILNEEALQSLIS